MVGVELFLFDYHGYMYRIGHSLDLSNRKGRRKRRTVGFKNLHLRKKYVADLSSATIKGSRVTEKHPDIAVRGGVKLTREYVQYLQDEIANLKKENELKAQYMKKLKMEKQ